MDKLCWQRDVPLVLQGNNIKFHDIWIEVAYRKTVVQITEYQAVLFLRKWGMTAMKVSECFERNVIRNIAHSWLCTKMPTVGHLLRIEAAKPGYQWKHLSTGEMHAPDTVIEIAYQQHIGTLYPMNWTDFYGKLWGNEGRLWQRLLECPNIWPRCMSMLPAEIGRWEIWLELHTMRILLEDIDVVTTGYGETVLISRII